MTALPPWLLGSTRIDPPLILAPMAGFTDAPMRWISHRHGASYACTEMVNAKALAAGAEASWRLLETLDGEGPVAAHLYGADPDDFARAAEKVTATGRFAAIDINCGCPVPKVTQCGAGAALMASPQRIGRIVAATVRHTHLPVTVKTRIGLRPGEEVAGEVARIVADQGASALALHGRFATQHHTGPVCHAAIAAVVAAGRLPVVGNGGIRSGADALAMVRQTGVVAVMVGWAAVGNPWLFGEIRSALQTGEAGPAVAVSVEEVRRALAEHLRLCLEYKRQLDGRWPGAALRVPPEEAVVLDFRCQLFRYLNGLRGITRLRGRLSQFRTLEEIQAATEEALTLETEFRARVGRK